MWLPEPMFTLSPLLLAALKGTVAGAIFFTLLYLGWRFFKKSDSDTTPNLRTKLSQKWRNRAATDPNK